MHFTDLLTIIVLCLYFQFYWRASEASETLSGVTNGNRRYIYIYIYMVRETHFVT